MNLRGLYELEGARGLARLADRVSASPRFLYQCATGRRFPSPSMGWRLVAADPRLRFEELYLDARPRRARTAAKAA